VLNAVEKLSFGMASNAKDVINVAFPEERCRAISRESFKFPEMHKDIGKSRSKFLAHGSAFNLKEGMVVKLKIITKKSEFRKDEKVVIRSAFGGVLKESILNRGDALLDRNIGIKRFDVKSEKNIIVLDVQAM
jgi:hypothetical protein